MCRGRGGVRSGLRGGARGRGAGRVVLLRSVRVFALARSLNPSTEKKKNKNRTEAVQKHALHSPQILPPSSLPNPSLIIPTCPSHKKSFGTPYTSQYRSQAAQSLMKIGPGSPSLLILRV